jgi:hypothetical protein
VGLTKGERGSVWCEAVTGLPFFNIVRFFLSAIDHSLCRHFSFRGMYSPSPGPVPGPNL